MNPPWPLDSEAPDNYGDRTGLKSLSNSGIRYRSFGLEPYDVHRIGGAKYVRDKIRYPFKTVLKRNASEMGDEDKNKCLALGN